MIGRTLVAAGLVLQLGACATVLGTNTEVYDDLNDGDVALATDVLQQTLETAPDGATRRWRNQDSGHSGTITPTRTYLSASGHFCRDYREELATSERSGRFYHTACRDDAEHWTWL